MTQFTCDCTVGHRGNGNCQEHSIIVTDKGLRMVTRKQHLAFYGIPDCKNQTKAQLWFAEMAKGTTAKAKWADGSSLEVDV